jgi:hypothetical protein
MFAHGRRGKLNHQLVTATCIKQTYWCSLKEGPGLDTLGSWKQLTSNMVLRLLACSCLPHRPLTNTLNAIIRGHRGIMLKRYRSYRETWGKVQRDELLSSLPCKLLGVLYLRPLQSLRTHRHNRCFNPTSPHNSMWRHPKTCKLGVPMCRHVAVLLSAGAPPWRLHDPRSFTHPK